MPQPSLEQRIDKAAEEILIVASRNGLVLCRASADGSFAMISDIGLLLSERTGNLAKIRCLEAASSPIGNSSQPVGNLLKQ